MALAWLLAQWNEIVPIPGTCKRTHLEENIAALDIEMTLEDLLSINEAAPHGGTWGERYPEQGMRAVNL